MSQTIEDKIPTSGTLTADEATTMASEFTASVDAALDKAAIDETLKGVTQNVTKTWRDKLRDIAALVVSGAHRVVTSPTFLTFREVGKEVALQEVEMGVAKLLREIVWKVYEKYLPMKEGNFFYNLRHGDSVQWRAARTLLLVIIFGGLAGLMFNLAAMEHDKGNTSRANKLDFVGRACFKAIMVETGHALNIEAFFTGIADTLISYLPDIKDDLEEGGKLIAEQMAKAPNTNGVKPMPPRGSGK